MRKILLTICSLILSAAIVQAKDTTSVSYLPSRFADNWFIQVGAVGNTVFNSGLGTITPGAELYVGKWFTPAFGLKVGALGWKNVPNGTQTGWFSGREAFWFGHADIDILWNAFNSGGNYKEKRFWDIIPYLRLSGIYTSQGEGGHVEPAAGIGIHNGLRLGKRVDFYLDVSAVVARETAYRERGTGIVFPTASAGFVFRLGHVGFRERQRVVEKETYIHVEQIIRDTVTVEKEKVVVDSVLIQQMREEPLTLFFDLDQTVLTQREIDHLEFYAKYVITPDSKLLLIGSADKETGSPSHNQWLSEQRNAYVKDILIRVYHLKPENIVEEANGDRKNEYRTMEQNRCVTIKFIE